MINTGSSKIAEMYVGSTKIAQAYVGSTIVFKLPASTGYDSYVIHLTWSSSDDLNLAGLHIDGVQPSTSDVTLQYHNGTWQTASSSDIQSAIQWDNNDNGIAFYCDGINITFTNASIPSTVQVKTGRWYGGGYMTVTMHVAGVKDGVETDLGYTSQTNAPNLIYTVNI